MAHWTDDLANVSDSVRPVRTTFDHRRIAFPDRAGAAGRPVRFSRRGYE